MRHQMDFQELFIIVLFYFFIFCNFSLPRFCICVGFFLAFSSFSNKSKQNQKEAITFPSLDKYVTDVDSARLAITQTHTHTCIMHPRSFNALSLSLFSVSLML